MTRIMIVEDDPAIADLIAIYLRRDGHHVDIFHNGAAALKAIERADPLPDLLILDLLLPGLDGRGIARRLRAFSELPIIMLTALDDDRDKIEGLDLGADDYLTKPFNPDELTARVRALLRRSSRRPDSAANLLTIANLTIALDGRRVLIEGNEIPLRAREFDLLLTFARHPGIVLTRQQLLEQVWDGEYDEDSRTVDVHVSRLRERLTAGGATLIIETLRSVGYRATAD